MTKASSSRAQGRFIPREELGDFTHWEFGSIGPHGMVPPAEVQVPQLPEPPDEAEQQAVLQQAMDDAYAQGLAQGRQESNLQWQQKLDDYVAGEGAAAAQRFGAVATGFEQGLAQAQQNLARDVLELACVVARQVLRRELDATGHAALLPTIREALASLSADHRVATVRLHPDDERALAEGLRTEFADRAVSWVADVDVLPGGCLVEQAGTTLDGRLDKRWQRAVAALGLELPLEEAPTLQERRQEQGAAHGTE